MAEPKPKAKASTRNTSFEFYGELIKPGESRLIELPLMKLYSHTEVSLPVKIINGLKPGPTFFLSAAVHGDEVNGVEIIRRFLNHPAASKLKGTALVVPVVNIHGLLSRSRYLPDRRDLNRAFPGSEKGSLAARIAHLFMTAIVQRSDYGLDLHCGSQHRSNLPQIRADLEDEKTNELAKAFGTPVILNSDLRDGSLRAAMAELRKPILLYEGGEALRLEEVVIRAGLKGIISVLRNIGSLPRVKSKIRPAEPFIARSSTWIRAEDSGLFRSHIKLGARVSRGDTVGFLSSPFGELETEVLSNSSGIVIGRTNLPLINEGEALFHIARFDKPRTVEQKLKRYQSKIEAGIEADFDDEVDSDSPIV